MGSCWQFDITVQRFLCWTETILRTGDESTFIISIGLSEVDKCNNVEFHHTRFYLHLFNFIFIVIPVTSFLRPVNHISIDGQYNVQCNTAIQ